MRFVYWLEDVFHEVRERYPRAWRILVAALFLALLLYGESMAYEDDQRDARIANEMAQKVQYWQEYKEVYGLR